MQTALERGKTLYHETYSDMKTGKKIFGITLGELIDQYLEWRREDAEVGHITRERVVTLQSQLKYIAAYKDTAGAPRALTVAHIARKYSAVISVSRRLRNLVRMSRS